jgi:gas vesicle protein
MSSNHKDSSTAKAGKFALGALITAIAGYIAGLLTAPKSGKETREDIKHKATDTYTAAEKELKRLHTELNDTIAQVTDKANALRGRSSRKFDDVTERGKNAKEKVREILSGLHDGEDVQDKDLKRAISEATKAIENLREFLKK